MENPDGSVTTTVIDEAGNTVTETTTRTDGVVVERVFNAAAEVEACKVVVDEDVAAALQGAPVEIAGSLFDAAPAGQVSVELAAGAQVCVTAGGAQELTPGSVLAQVQADGSVTVLPKTAFDASAQSITAALDAGQTTLVVVDAGQMFDDVSPNAWYAQSGVIEFVTARGLISGVEAADGNYYFCGDDTLTRGMFVTILYRLEGSPVVSASGTFDDVAAGQWYSAAVQWAAEQGIVGGYGNGSFGPNDAITREQMAVIMQRYAASLGCDVSARTDAGMFTDAAQLTFGQDAASWAAATGLMTGYPDTGEFGPTRGATRAEACTVVQRAVSWLLTN